MSIRSRFVPWLATAGLACVPLLAACADAPTAPRATVHPEITSGELPGGQRSLFFITRPRDLHHFTGTFDATLHPEVLVCRDASCATPVLGPVGLDATGSATLTLDTKRQTYDFVWHTRGAALDPNAVFRLVVRVGHYELGYVDIATGTKQTELKDIDRREFLPVRLGSTVKLPFRIEQGAPFPADIPGRYESDPGICPEGCSFHGNPWGEYFVMWGGVQISQTGDAITGSVGYFSPFGGPPPEIPPIPAAGTGPLTDPLPAFSWRIADDDPACYELWSDGLLWGHWCGTFGGDAGISANYSPFVNLGGLYRLPNYVVAVHQ
jgi:hypothetical protein